MTSIEGHRKLPEDILVGFVGGRGEAAYPRVAFNEGDGPDAAIHWVSADSGRFLARVPTRGAVELGYVPEKIEPAKLVELGPLKATGEALALSGD